VNVLAGAALERLTVDGPLETDGDPVAGFSLGALAFRGKGAVLVGNPLDGLVDVVSPTSATGFSTAKLLKSASLIVGTTSIDTV